MIDYQLLYLTVNIINLSTNLTRRELLYLNIDKKSLESISIQLILISFFLSSVTIIINNHLSHKVIFDLKDVLKYTFYFNLKLVGNVILSNNFSFEEFCIYSFK